MFLNVVCMDAASNKLYYTNGTERTWESPAPHRASRKRKFKLHVHNIPREVTSQEFTQFFKPHGAKKAVLKLKPDSTAPGFGIITVRTTAIRDALLKTPFTLHGSKLSIQLPPTKEQIRKWKEYKAARDNYMCQVIINGLPGTATLQDVQNAFHIYSPRAVRVPVDKNGGCKGFAFVEFESEEQRNNILAQLRRINICGRNCQVRECRPPKKGQNTPQTEKPPNKIEDRTKTPDNALPFLQTAAPSQPFLRSKQEGTSQSRASHSSVSPPPAVGSAPPNALSPSVRVPGFKQGTPSSRSPSPLSYLSPPPPPTDYMDEYESSEESDSEITDNDEPSPRDTSVPNSLPPPPLSTLPLPLSRLPPPPSPPPN